jgi:hypothetical protein
VQLIVAWPVLLTTLLLVVQTAVWAYASYTAQAAAARGLDAARLLGGTPADGQTEAQHVLEQLDAGPLADAHVQVSSDTRTVTVRISGHTEQILPWLHLPVHAQASGPLENPTGLP